MYLPLDNVANLVRVNTLNVGREMVPSKQKMLSQRQLQ